MIYVELILLIFSPSVTRVHTLAYNWWQIRSTGSAFISHDQWVWIYLIVLASRRLLIYFSLKIFWFIASHILISNYGVVPFFAFAIGNKLTYTYCKIDAATYRGSGSRPCRTQDWSRFLVPANNFRTEDYGNLQPDVVLYLVSFRAKVHHFWVLLFDSWFMRSSCVSVWCIIIRMLEVEKSFDLISLNWVNIRSKI